MEAFYGADSWIMAELPISSVNMKRLRLPLILTAVALAATAYAAAIEPSSSLDLILQDLANTATPDQALQVVDAIRASPRLTESFDRLASARQLTGIRIVAPEALQSVRNAHFSAYLDGTQIVIAAPLLKELSKSRLYDLVQSGDVLPNNTTFVLAHLAYHLRTAQEASFADDKFRRQVQAMSQRPGSHDYTVILQAHSQAALTDEASAVIEAWDDTIDAASSQAHAQLQPPQFVSVLMNLRYRGILNKAMKQTPHMVITDGGYVEANANNMQAVVAALKSSQLMDVQ